MNRIIAIFSILFLFLGTSCPKSYAAFVIKPSINNGLGTINKPEIKQNDLADQIEGLANAVSSKIFPNRHWQYDRVSSRSKTGWPGILSIIFAGLGLIFLAVMLSAAFSTPVAPLNLIIGFVGWLVFAICAMAFGGLGISKKKHRNTGLAIAGLILGGLEIIVPFAVLAAYITVAISQFN